MLNNNNAVAVICILPDTAKEKVRKPKSQSHAGRGGVIFFPLLQHSPAGFCYCPMLLLPHKWYPSPAPSYCYPPAGVPPLLSPRWYPATAPCYCCPPDGIPPLPHATAAHQLVSRYSPTLLTHDTAPCYSCLPAGIPLLPHAKAAAQMVPRYCPMLLLPLRGILILAHVTAAHQLVSRYCWYPATAPCYC